MTFDEILKLVQGGGNALLVFIIWIAWNATNKAKEAVESLKSIDEGLGNMRKENVEAFREIDREIAEVKAAVEYLPIKMRAVR